MSEPSDSSASSLQTAGLSSQEAALQGRQMGKDRGGSVVAGCGSLVRDSSSGQALTKQKQKKGVPGGGGVDESTK